MTQSCIIAFEAGLDGFMQGIRAELLRREQIRIEHQVIPQCLDCLRVIDEESSIFMLRLVLVGYGPDLTLGRLSWLEENGQEHICCYLDSSFEVVKLKYNGLWVKEKHTAEAMCLTQWSRLHSLVLA